MPRATSYDAALAAQVKEFQSVHGIKPDGIAGAGTIEALNRGAQYYEQLIIINMERAKRLPAPEEQRKYVLVDAGDARLSMWENGRKVDEMKVVVGKAETATPMMAAYIKYASVNPYWNVPPELVRSLIGPRVVAQGVSYLTDREYQVLTDYSDDAKIIDPHDVDWQAVVDGRQEVRLRRLAEPGQLDGHDEVHAAQLFRHLSSRFAGEGTFHEERAVDQQRLRSPRGLQAPRAASCSTASFRKGKNPKVEEEVDLPKPVPVYMTYLTAQPTADGVQFMPDHYGRDAHLMERFGTQLTGGGARPSLAGVLTTLRHAVAIAAECSWPYPISYAAVRGCSMLALVFFASYRSCALIAAGRRRAAAAQRSAPVLASSLQRFGIALARDRPVHARASPG